MKERIARLQEQLDDHSAFYIQSPVNRRYLTDFPSSAGCVLVTKNQSYFFTDFRYLEKAKQQVKTCEVKEFLGFSKTVLPTLQQACLEQLFVETESTGFRAFRTLQTVAQGVEISDSDKLDTLLEEMRMIKTSGELAKIREAQRLTDETYTYILDRISAGRSEIDIMLDMEFFMRKQGSQGVSFDFIVVSGKNSSLPHGIPTNKLVESGDFITMDFGGVVDGYHSDMTRTVAVGSVNDHQRLVYETVLQAKKKAMESIAPNTICKDVDKVARDLIDHAGFQGCFGHGLGHGVGLEIHESPNFNTRCETLLQPGMVLTVEPGIYLENQFGVRIEDMVEITCDGYTNFTKSTDELIVL